MNHQMFYTRLMERKAELTKRLEEKERFGLEENTRDSLGELSLYDNHPADIGTELFERGKDLALHEMLERELADVNEALEKISAGTYGICEVTGKKIPHERLVANPTAKTVVECANSSFKNERPVEEEVLEAFEKERKRRTDGDDAYDQVARFNDNGMTFADEYFIDNEEQTGAVEGVEALLATDMYGYSGEERMDVENDVEDEQYREDE